MPQNMKIISPISVFVTLSGRYNDMPERSRVDPSSGQSSLRAVQPEAHHRAEHPVARCAAIAVRPALAHTRQTQPVTIIYFLYFVFKIYRANTGCSVR